MLVKFVQLPGHQLRESIERLTASAGIQRLTVVARVEEMRRRLPSLVPLAHPQTRALPRIGSTAHVVSKEAIPHLALRDAEQLPRARAGR